MRVKSLLLELLLLNQHSSSFGEIVHASINAQPSPKTQSPFKVPFIRSIRPRATVTSQQVEGLSLSIVALDFHQRLENIQVKLSLASKERSSHSIFGSSTIDNDEAKER